jgi:hypothetical protein
MMMELNSSLSTTSRGQNYRKLPCDRKMVNIFEKLFVVQRCTTTFYQGRVLQTGRGQGLCSGCMTIQFAKVIARLFFAEVEKLCNILVRLQEQATESAPTGTSKWRGNITYLCVIMCLTDDHVKHLFLIERTQGLGRK